MKLDKILESNYFLPTSTGNSPSNVSPRTSGTPDNGDDSHSKESIAPKKPARKSVKSGRYSGYKEDISDPKFFSKPAEEEEKE